MMHLFHKKNGDEAYGNQAYHNAVFHYTLAIETARSELASNNDPSLKKQLASLYSNRAAASTMMRHYHEALTDCDAAICAYARYDKAYLRKAQLQLMNGLLEDAIATCDQVMKMDASNSAARDYRSEILAMQQKYKSAKKFIESLYNTPQHSILREKITNTMDDVESILKTCIAWNELKVFKAELLWALGNSDEAYQLTQKLVKKGEVENSSLHNLRAQIFVSMGRSEDAIRNLRMVLAHDPNNQRASKLFFTLRAFLDRKAAADMAYKNRKFDDALLQYEHAMTMCPSPAYMAKLFFNRACTEASLHRHEDAIHDCNEAIRLNEDYIKAYMRRAASLRMRETDKPQQCELAMRDYQAALSLCKTKAESREIVKKLKETRAELRELKREDISKIEKMIRRQSESSDSPKIGRNRNRASSNPDLHITRSRTSSMSSAYSSHDFGSPGNMTSPKQMYTEPVDFGPL